MSDEQLVATVRHFNRSVTQRVGALDDAYLTRGRPLAQARLLWEIGPAGAEIAALRTRLNLDAGYLSRLLRTLEGDGLVMVGSADGDGRVRTARLTAAGRAEWDVLDRLSDELAWSILAPLSESQRARLAGAMAEVERLLMASLVELQPCHPGDPRARACLRAYARELDRRFDGGFDPARSGMDDEELVPPNGLFLVATLSAEPVGCGALRLHPGGPAEIKRVWVSESVRGLGVGRRIMGELEQRASAAGADTVRLDTNRTLTEAIRLYRTSGYHEIPAYNDNPYAHHWFAKPLDPAAAPPL
ncbi:bifunctional helix-turn-helix transcriptional regulator/GNAT family N-acetyltransferase [Catellatospora sichuanensis]|uniref:bifunctional helix-turn-helix transcriptional regulator/GNAT family N-acetyltransferase n=1 Tax=Catellatospora sichuanensis TaxID=1969805 RepID=UPI001182F31D|nr:helix-turn-helix domain-containing GNAT family N-acetyltransferase [Catellatospora sichuanensis]